MDVRIKPNQILLEDGVIVNGDHGLAYWQEIDDFIRMWRPVWSSYLRRRRIFPFSGLDEL